MNSDDDLSLLLSDLIYPSASQDTDDDDGSSDVTREDSGNKNSNSVFNFTIINANARSLCPKIVSLLDCLEELKVGVGIVTETWMADRATLEDDVDDLVQCSGYGMLYKKRCPNSKGPWGCRSILQEV